MKNIGLEYYCVCASDALITFEEIDEFPWKLM
jgi:hypothetical protein